MRNLSIARRLMLNLAASIAITLGAVVGIVLPVAGVFRCVQLTWRRRLAPRTRLPSNCWTWW